jgi:uncharacterized protein YoxC
MAIDAYAIGDTIDDHAMELSALDQSVSGLRRDLDALTERHETLDQQVNIIEMDTLEPLRRSVTDLEETAEQLVDNLTQTRVAVRHLASQVQWLEHHVTTAAGLTPVQIDQASPDLRSLAAMAQQAREARAGQLSTWQRNQLQAQVSKHEQLGDQRQQLLKKAVAHSGTLVEVPASGDKHAVAVAGFRASVSQANLIAAQINSSNDSVAEARVRLAADDEYRQAHATAIAAGDQAQVALHRKLRQRITDAIGTRALFPAWFTTVLGYGPPADGTTEWIAAAADLIAYRITYAITDPAVALGAPPEPEQTTRATLHEELTAKLRKLQQRP